MENIHQIDLKRRCLLLIGKKCLAETLKYLCFRHPDGHPHISFDLRYREICQKNGDKSFEKYQKTKYWKFQNNIIDELDIEGLSDIINFSCLKLLEHVRCCTDCTHDCHNHIDCSKHKKKRTNSEAVNCNKKPCKNCGNICEAMVIQHCAFLLKMLRNVTSHIDDNKKYIALEERRIPITPFESCLSWKDIWGKMNDPILECFKILKKHNFINDNDYKDHETDLWICLRKKKDDLWVLFGNHLKDIPTKEEIFTVFKQASINTEGKEILKFVILWEKLAVTF